MLESTTTSTSDNMTKYYQTPKSVGVKSAATTSTLPTHPLSLSPASTRSFHSSLSRRRLFSTSTGGSTKSNHRKPHDEDRFIPSRRRIRLDLCQKALFSTEDDSAEVTNTNALDHKSFLTNSLLGVSSTDLDRHGNPKCLIARRRRNADPDRHLRQCDSPGRRYFNWDDGAEAAYTPFQTSLCWNRYDSLSFGASDTLSTLGMGEASEISSQDLYTSHGIQGIACVQHCKLPGKEHLLTIGTLRGTIYLLDLNAQQIHTTIAPRKHREDVEGYVPCFDWNEKNGLLSSNSRYMPRVLHHDIRDPSLIVGRKTHPEPFCKLQWNCDGTTLATLGMNGKVRIWDASMSNGKLKARTRMKHRSAFTMDWHPSNPNCLVTGSLRLRPSDDSAIKVWNTSNGKLKTAVHTDEAVSSVLWSKDGKQFCSAHGTYKLDSITMTTLKSSELKTWRTDVAGNFSLAKSFNNVCGGIVCLAQSRDGKKLGALHDGHTASIWDDVFGLGSKGSVENQDCKVSSDTKRRRECDNIWPFGKSQLGGMPVIR